MPISVVPRRGRVPFRVCSIELAATDGPNLTQPLKAKPQRPKTDADHCRAHVGSPILACPIGAAGTKHPEFTCPLAACDKCDDDRSG